MVAPAVDGLMAMLRCAMCDGNVPASQPAAPPRERAISARCVATPASVSVHGGCRALLGTPAEGDWQSMRKAASPVLAAARSNRFHVQRPQKNRQTLVEHWLPWHKPCCFKRQVRVGPRGSVLPSCLPCPALQPRACYLDAASLLPHLNYLLPIEPDSQSFAQLDSPPPLAVYHQHSALSSTHLHHHYTNLIKMRFSTTAVFAAVAIGAQALPQEAQPITQISDGQIQVSFAQSLYAFTSNANILNHRPLLLPLPLPALLPALPPSPLPDPTRFLRLPLPLRSSPP